MNIEEIKEAIPSLNKYEIEEVLKAIAEKLFIAQDGYSYMRRQICVSTEDDMNNCLLKINFKVDLISEK